MIEEKIRERKKKVSALPIPEVDYTRFKYRLEEMSKDCPDRNMMIFYIDIATGYRLGDIVGLTIGELKEFLQEDKFIIQESKQYLAWKRHIEKFPQSKRKAPASREAIIQPKLRKLIRDFVKGKKNSEYAFKSETYKDKHITAKTYSDILKSVGDDLGLKHITGHSLRKTYAQRLWVERRDLEFVRKALGHKSIETTKYYLGLDNEIKEDASRIADSKL
ncbi:MULTISPECIES: tyrosine-type recombinase/integrase [unclassified Clostridium]|uniref:tyrosine-type recombinase/integrase n=1 Tax=unclassified Clostridium TaxID=2614128 RepID=UPI001C8C7821|nr:MULTISPECIES: tyrosine-type recombinase/integrase [unclassified Clostridium]MBX9136713.1 tyrosine-type recombinase/integrase [Clostridium sp. K12(2020)]MBX9145138.1 tyrosine-type recombinase/integrase [Clostridium sp. K13]MDU4327363.1 tyrosine-type recombinase/integrase [Clostridium celatum]